MPTLYSRLSSLFWAILVPRRHYATVIRQMQQVG
jgi:hypothetical protein